MTSKNQNFIKPLDVSNIEQASLMFGEIYENDPLMIHFFPNVKSRKKNIEALFSYQLRCRSEQTFQTKDMSFAICVFEDSRKLGEALISWKEITLGLSLLFQIGLPSLLRLLKFQLFSQSIRQKTMKENHWYLDLFAVEKKCQSKGIGRNFLNNLFKLATAENNQIYLETTNIENERYYRKFGFQVIKQAVIPGTQIPYFCMSLKLYPENQIAASILSASRELPTETVTNLEN